MIELGRLTEQSATFTLAVLALVIAAALVIAMRSERRLREREGARPPSVWVPIGFVVIAVMLTVVGLVSAVVE